MIELYPDAQTGEGKRILAKKRTLTGAGGHACRCEYLTLSDPPTLSPPKP